MHKIAVYVLSVAMIGCSVNVSAGMNEQIVSGEDIVAGGQVLSADVLGEPSENVEDEEMGPNESDEIGSEGDVETENEVVSDNTQEEHGNEEQVVSENEMDDISVNSVSTNDDVNESISDGQEENGSEETKTDSVSEEEEKKEQGLQKDVVISKVEIPTKVHVNMDIDEGRGGGEISSERYDIVNHGNRDIAIKIKNIRFSYRAPQDAYEVNGETNKEISAQKDPKTKKINVDIIWENEDESQRKVLKPTDGKMDEYVLYLKAAKYGKNGEFKGLNVGSKGTFRFAGSIESEPGLEWNAQEIALGLDYEIVNMGEQQENREDADGFIQNALAAVGEDSQPNEKDIVENEGPNIEMEN